MVGESRLDRVARVVEERKLQRDRAYRQLARDWASGEAVADDEEVARVLEDAGKSPEELEADVRKYERLFQDAETAQQAPALEQRLREIQEAIAEQDATLKAAQQAHSAAVQQLHEEGSRLRLELQQADVARQRLAEACDDPEIRQKLAALESQHTNAMDHWRTLWQRLQQLERELAPLRHNAQREHRSREGQAEAQRRYESAQREIARLQQEVPAAQRRADELNRELYRFRREDMTRVY